MARFNKPRVDTLTPQDLRVLTQLSMCKEAAFCLRAGNNGHVLYAYFGSHAGPLDYEGNYPRVVPGDSIQRLYNFGILQRKVPTNSVFKCVYTLNRPRLQHFEQLREISVQIALGTWFKLSGSELDTLMDYPG
ncbi:hypothetical protein LCGC14_1224710 [marine sediment metagenome]|uniref:Uncharacterized protein n=1 Tax=marine sediment metagenome TaxID=412755 RepID=A0A0F9LXH3_9ZZZZ